MDGLFDFYAAHDFWVWTGLAAAILATEVAIGSGWLLWPSASAAAVGVLSLLTPLGLPVALFLFAVLTIASTLLARRYFPRSEMAAAGDINDNVGRLVGQEGQAVQAFLGGHGRIAIDGKEWAAELEEGETLAAGQDVRVVGVTGGTRLRVRPSSS
ncbi:MAG: NfeD family protein [Phenylobacterium sp.]|uniref:NfeD family protein n=1 Tax=Phenylobacterium sp. TaxID=1871053 RepID=UPI0039197875